MKKILVVTPKFPFLKTGACDQDRACGIEDLIKYGYEVVVITKTYLPTYEKIYEESTRLGIKIIPVSYKFTKELPFWKQIKKHAKRLCNPLYWDGAAYEYYDKEIQNLFKKELDSFKPDLVWFDYTYLWPLYGHAQKRNIPIVTRSINFEPIHFLQEDGVTILNAIKFIPKFFGEILVIKKSNFIFSITPKEENIYRMFGAKNVSNLPLRGLPNCLKQVKNIVAKSVINVFFMGSTYNVSHNRMALEFLVKKIIPEVNRQAPGRFIFHILGAKMPKDIHPYFKGNIVYSGFVENLDAFLEDMDIAVIPSLMGAGMQQKIFEPLSRGIPSVISPRGIAGYPFDNQVHALFASDTKEFVKCILKLEDINLRKKISKNALALCNEIFSEQKISKLTEKGLTFIQK